MLVSKEDYNKIPPTLLKHMGIVEKDLQEPEHDDICLKLTNEELLQKIFLDKVYKGELQNDTYTAKCEILKLSHTADGSCYFKVNDDSFSSFSSRYKIKETLKNPTIYRKSELDVIDSKIGHVVVKRGRNGFSQRLGFVDVFCRLSVVKTWEIKYENEFHQLQYEDKDYVMFFKIKTSRPSISIVSREIEFFRDALRETEGVSITPFYVGHNKIPVSQFDSITFDEILKMEEELK